jgi:hypothetical protein
VQTVDAFTEFERRIIVPWRDAFDDSGRDD